MMQSRKARLVATVHLESGPRRIEVTARGDAQLLRLLACGEWVTPKQSGISGKTLSRHASELRRNHSLPVQTEAVQVGSKFHNRHRLLAPVSIEDVAP